MHVLVNGVRLFFDVEGAKLVPDGSFMREKPTLLMLHGGPGSDHSIYEPAYSDLADVAQITWTIVATVEARMDPRKAGIWLSGATTYVCSATLSASQARSSVAHHSAAWSRWPTPRAIPPILRNWC
jgi:hypothetical protein